MNRETWIEVRTISAASATLLRAVHRDFRQIESVRSRAVLTVRPRVSGLDRPQDGDEHERREQREHHEPGDRTHDFAGRELLAWPSGVSGKAGESGGTPLSPRRRRQLSPPVPASARGGAA